ncbi:MAG: stage II sporulation protein M [Bernardetiaceae bacterium]|nr:stage II sporulation protein M [Bernardetiaceae bacterium]
MREAVFVQKNTARWQKFEEELNTQFSRQKTTANPDALAEMFIQLTDDLAYARTFYPNSHITNYLNQMVGRAHRLLYRNKREEIARIWQFWKVELPLLFYSVRNLFFFSLAFFVLSVGIGVISSVHFDDFARLILGDSYVNMTLDNIQKNDPMAVYKSSRQADMFMGITFNNIRVSFYAFAGGILTPLFTLYILLINGVMVGVFQYFFYERGLFLTSFLTIWIHATLEIAAIIVAGTAGIVMGSSYLFPGTYTRMEAFKIGAKKGLKMVAGVAPIFVVAAFLESFVTRLTEMPAILKIAIIGSSLTFFVWYFIVYPAQLAKKITYNSEQEYQESNL